MIKAGSSVCQISTLRVGVVSDGDVGNVGLLEMRAYRKASDCNQV